MNERKPSHLTPEQAADVIRYYDRDANGEARARGWRDKVALGEVAARTTLKRFSILPNQTKPMLTPEEMGAGLDYIQNPPEPDKSEAYYQKLDELADKLGNYDLARRQLDADGWQ
ncbi:MAG TPA: hypothetical protein VFG56_02680 [Candidatus Saccharimonadales bacterium]|nr:hypothetical protein [Candidatus Saccharimonadales bacterium]